MPLYLGSNLISDMYIGVAASGVSTTAITITANGAYTPPSGTYYSGITVNIPNSGTVNNQNITITPGDSTTVVTAASGYTGLGQVTVNAIPNNYIGSGILENDNTDLDVSGPVVTVPAGYYATTASTNVTTASHAAPSLTLTTSTGAIRATHTATTGYVTAGTTTADLALTTKTATTYTPTTTNQTIAAYQYLTGIQTIVGDVNLVAGNIKSGISIFGVAGSYTGTSINNQNITITPSESTTVVSATNEYTGLGTVTINGISTTYIGSQVPTRTSSNLTISGPTVYAPPGYYAATANTSLAISTVTNSVITGQAYLETTNDYGWRTTVSIPAGYYNTISLTATYSSFFPAPNTSATDNTILLGYEAYDKDGKKITGSMANNSYSATLNQSTTSVTIPAGYHDGTGTVSHNTVTVPNPTISVSATNGVITASGTWTRGFTTNASYTTTAIPYTTLGATTYNATSNNITIAAGRYLTGAQTIRGVTISSIAAGDIRSGVIIQVGDSENAGRIANVTGTLVVNKYYTGSSAPSSSLGNNGDIYLQA